MPEEAPVTRAVPSLRELLMEISRIRRHRIVTCMMIVTGLYPFNAARRFFRNGLPDRPRLGTGRRMVEHPDPARCLPWPHALRPVPAQPADRAEYADTAVERSCRIRIARAPALQRAAATARICTDRAGKG